MRFAGVGTLGFLVDSCTLYGALWAGFNLYTGRLVSFLVAVSFTWYLNRRVTFRSIVPPSASEWLLFVFANGGGGLANLAVYAALVATIEQFARLPILAVAIGSVTGLLINFVLSRSFVFRAQ